MRGTEDGGPPSAGVVEAKAKAAGAMAKTFSNASILGYCEPSPLPIPAAARVEPSAADIFDEVGPGSMPVDAAVTSAVRGNDSYHPTFSLVCGVQCSGYSNALNARRYAEQHQVSAVDSCKRGLSLDWGTSPWQLCCRDDGINCPC